MAIRPLINPEQIKDRQKKVTYFKDHGHCSHWTLITEGMNDIERVTSKICSRFNNPKDMVALKNELNLIPKILAFIESLGINFESKTHALKQLYDNNNRSLSNLAATLNQALGDDVPSHCREGEYLR